MKAQTPDTVTAIASPVAPPPPQKITICKKGPKPAAPAPTVPKVVIAGGASPRPEPECRVAISPRAALVQSLLVPGLGQWKLYRPKAAGIFAAVELGSIGMVIKSKHDLDVATKARRDTADDGKPKNQNIADRVKARRTHLEDWIAMIVFNHLFSGADAWVAANLADFDVNVNTTSAGREVKVVARISW